VNHRKSTSTPLEVTSGIERTANDVPRKVFSWKSLNFW
jgi:hypothetical protein